MHREKPCNQLQFHLEFEPTPKNLQEKNYQSIESITPIPYLMKNIRARRECISCITNNTNKMKVYITLIERYTNLTKKANIICPYLNGIYVPQERDRKIVLWNPNM